MISLKHHKNHSAYFSPFSISYRNQSFDLTAESNDWFPYEMQHLAEMG